MRSSVGNQLSRDQKRDSQEPSMTLPLFDGRGTTQKLIDNQPPLSVAAVIAKPTLTQALKLCFEHPGLDDKQAASLMDLDPGQFSRIMGATGHFPTNRYVEFMERMGNDAPLIWLANRRGYELRRIQTDVEQQLEAERAKSAELERQLEVITNFVRSTR